MSKYSEILKAWSKMRTRTSPARTVKRTIRSFGSRQSQAKTYKAIHCRVCRAVLAGTDGNDV